MNIQIPARRTFTHANKAAAFPTGVKLAAIRCCEHCLYRMTMFQMRLTDRQCKRVNCYDIVLALLQIAFKLQIHSFIAHFE